MEAQCLGRSESARSARLCFTAVAPDSPESPQIFLRRPSPWSDQGRSPENESSFRNMRSWAELQIRPEEVEGKALGKASGKAFEEASEEEKACDSCGRLLTSGKNVTVSLADLNLIIVGSGPVAAEILHRRRLAGGRACLLWTEQMPVLSNMATLNLHPLSELRRAVFSLRDFCWQPPSMTRTNVREVEELKAAYRCWSSAVCRQGPDIVALEDGQVYSITQDVQGRACGIEVLDGLDGTQLWSMCGAVVFAGEAFGEQLKAACDTMHLARELDVSVHFEDAKPLTTMSARTCFWSCLYSFVHLTIYCWFMRIFETPNTPDQLPWWRGTFTVGLFPYGFAAYYVYWANCLAGTKFPLGMRLSGGLSACILFSFFFIWSRQASGDYRPLFSAFFVGTVAYTFVSVVFHAIWYTCCGRFQISSKEDPDNSEGGEAAKSAHKLNHVLWTWAHILFTFGSWILLYFVSMLFMNLESYSKSWAAVFLTVATNLTEKFVSSMTTWLYTGLVYNVRSRPDGKGILGDQRKHLMLPVALTHSFCESARLVSLLSVTMCTGGWWWPFNIALNLSLNLLERSYGTLSLLAYFFPFLARWWLPGIGMVLHQEAKLWSGYAQYVSVLAFLTADIISGHWASSVFNIESICLMITCVLAELVEDFVISFRMQPNSYWRQALLEVYAAHPILHPRQLLCIDKVGVAWASPPLSLHGTGILDLWEVAAFMLPATYFSLVLMTLLLGAGYMHGVCPNPLPAEMRLVDGLSWTSPLRCM